MKQSSCNQYGANWLDRNYLGFLNLLFYALRSHTREETRELALAAPLKPYEMNGLWPRPWLYLRTMLVFVVAFVLLYACWILEMRQDASTLLPGMVIVGSLAVPVTLVIFFWETNKWRTLTLLDVLGQMLIGSCAAIAITFILQQVLDYLPDYRVYWNARGNYFTPRLLLNVGLMPMALTALIEELAKASIIFVLLYRFRHSSHILQGMTIGATVGAGFAVFESSGYALIDLHHLLQTLMMRSLMAPFCHVAWGALMGGGATIIMRKRKGKMQWLHPWLLMLFGSVATLHFAWNFLVTYSTRLNPLVELSIVIWAAVMLLMWRGVRECN